MHLALGLLGWLAVVALGTLIVGGLIALPLFLILGSARRKPAQGWFAQVEADTKRPDMPWPEDEQT